MSAVFAVAMTSLVAGSCRSGGPSQTDCEAALERRAELAVADTVSRAEEHRKQIADASRKSFLAECEARGEKAQKKLVICLEAATSRAEANQCR